MDSILFLEQVDHQFTDQVGGKGANLGKLMRAGFPVPAGFCLTTDVFRNLMRENCLERLSAEIFMHQGSGEQLAQRAADLRQRICSNILPARVVEGIATAYTKLGQEAVVAVRSSATEEDSPNASLAGQYATYLGVQGISAVLDATLRCWASFFEERAIAYRRDRGLKPTDGAFAIVVQTMIPAEVAGVLFTAHPVTAQQDEIVVEAVYGLGETLVSGQVTPDHFVLARAGLDIRQRQWGRQTQIAYLTQTGRVERTALAPASGPCLVDAQLQELARLGLSVEDHFGQPQDIEWAFREGKFFLLQTRPITAFGRSRPLHVCLGHPELARHLAGQLLVHSNFNVRETMPYPQLPFVWSLWNDLSVPKILARVLGVSGQHPLLPYYHLFSRVNGRLYWNINVLWGIPILGWLSRHTLRATDLNVYEAVQDLSRRRLLRPMRIPHRLGHLWLMLKNIPRLLYALGTFRRWLTPTAAWQIQQAHQQKVLRFAQREHHHEEPGDLFREIRLFVEDSLDHMAVCFGWLVLGVISYDLLRLVCAGSQAEIPTESLVAGIAGNPTTQTALDLWALSRMEESVAQVFAHPPEGRLAEIPRQLATTEAGRAYLTRLEAFLAQHGHRGALEFDISYPRWKDDPTFVLQMICNYLDHDPQAPTPPEHFAQLAQRRQQLTALAEERFRRGVAGRFFPFRLWLFRLALFIAHQYLPLRESPKYHLLMGASEGRRALLQVGQALVQRGIFRRAEELFCFSIEEMEHICDGTWGTAQQIAAAVDERLAQHERWCKETPDLIVRSDGVPVPIAASFDQDVLTGQPVSLGHVIGRGRVMFNPGHGAALKQGEILVAPFTDPGWTPLFLTAGGLVMEIGGVMSHGAVVAREYGLPAIVSVKDATSHIHNGDLLELDCAQGAVRILERAQRSCVKIR